jgi:hypothetical protein
MHDAEAVRGLLCFAADTVYAEGGARRVLQLEPRGGGWVGLLCLALTPECPARRGWAGDQRGAHPGRRAEPPRAVAAADADALAGLYAEGVATEVFDVMSFDEEALLTALRAYWPVESGASEA